MTQTRFNLYCIVFVLLASCSDEKKKPETNLSTKDSIYRKQDSIVKEYKEILVKEVYPKIKPEDKKNINVINKFFGLTSNSTESKKIITKIKQIAAADTSDWDIGKLIISQELQDWIYNNSIYTARILDWKSPSQQLADIINRSISHKVSTASGEEMIDKTYTRFGKELSQHGLMLFNMDINCDCYMPFVIKQKDRAKAKELVNRLGFKYEEWTEVW